MIEQWLLSLFCAFLQIQDHVFILTLIFMAFPGYQYPAYCFFCFFFCGISYVHSFIPTEHLWNQTLSRGGKVSANHNSEPFETTKTRYSLHRFQNSVFHGSGRKKGSLCCESPNKEIKSLSECRCHIVRSGRAENSFLQCVGWLHIK